MIRTVLFSSLGIILSTIAFATSAATCPTLTQTLALDSRGDEVAALQQFLTDMELLKEVPVPSYFDVYTQQALQKYQAQVGIVSSGSPSSTGWGVLGPETRSAIASCKNTSSTPAPARPRSAKSVAPTSSTPSVPERVVALLAQVEQLQAIIAKLIGAQTATPVSTPAPSSTDGATGHVLTITRSLDVGATGSDVSELQTFLKAEGYFQADITGYFGPITRQAVMSLQRDHGLRAVGRVGPLTRNLLSDLTSTRTPQTITTSITDSADQSGGLGNTSSESTSCTLDGQTIASGSSQTFYSSQTVAYGTLCSATANMQTRTCTDGTLSGTYTNATCTPGDTPAPIYTHTEFANPEQVTIQGYNGPAQDPTISPDGTILFFDSHTDDPKIPVKQYWAKKVDYKTFAFQGEIKGVNHAGEQTLTATMDRNHNLYFTTTHFNPPFPTIAKGIFTNGTVTQVVSIKSSKNAPPAASLRPGDILDLANVGMITQDGGTLYVSDLQYKIGSNGQPTPVAGTISLHRKNSNGSFTEASNSGSLLKNVNALGKILYGGGESTDGLELFFTGSDMPGSSDARIRLYVARRPSTSEPFGTPEEVTTPWKLLETPYPSPDGTHLYFHRILSDTDAKVYVMTR